MHATPQRVCIEEPVPLPSLRTVPPGPTLSQRMLRLLRLLRISFWRAFVHDAFATAKASAYSSILTFFPLLFIVGSWLANWRRGGRISAKSLTHSEVFCPPGPTLPSITLRVRVNIQS